MTVAAIDTIVADVVLVTELNRLLSFNPLSGIPRRAVQLCGGPQCGNDHEGGSVDRNFRKRVGAVMEDLHGSMCGSLLIERRSNRDLWSDN